jgi:hypothetical protein
MTAPVSVSPVLESLIKPLIVADFGVSFSENPGRMITDEKISINKQILVLIQIQLLPQTCLPPVCRLAGQPGAPIGFQEGHTLINSKSVSLLLPGDKKSGFIP